MNQREAILETMRRILRQTTLRPLLRPLGRAPIDVTQVEADLMLEPYEEAIERDFVMCCEVADQLVALSHQGEEARAMATEADSVMFDSDDEDPDT
jgi:hypothetical protein